MSDVSSAASPWAPASAPSAQWLRSARCVPLGPNDALHDDALAVLLPCVPGWSVRNDHLESAFTFSGWFETLAFVNALGWMAQAQDHHPDLLVSHHRCVVRWTTHSAHGIALNDFICAALTDALVATSRPNA